MYFTLFGCWAHGAGASPKGLVHNLLMQLFTLGSSKIEVFETYFFDTVTSQYDHPRYIKHVLGHICVFFTTFWYWAQGGGVQRNWYTTCRFSPWDAQKSKLSKVIFLYHDHLK